MRFPILVVASVILLGSLNGCVGGAALMAISAVGGATSIAKNVFDVDVDIHTLLGQSRPAQPTPPANASLNGK